MKYAVEIKAITSVDQIIEYWSIEDYIKLLEEFNFGGAESNDPTELRDLLFMAITDFEPSEAAEIMLTYKFPKRLSTGQINQLSHEMLEDKVAEEYPDIALHADLFHVNQLLHKAYNGRFPSVKASIIQIELRSLAKKTDLDIDKERLLKILNPGLSDRSLLKRLFHDQLDGKIVFPEADGIIWELHPLAEGNFKVVTSDYWLNEEDLDTMSFESQLTESEDLPQG